MDENVVAIIRWASSLGGTAVGMMVGWAVYTGRLVIRREVELQSKLLADMTKDRDEWKGMAVAGLKQNARLTEVGERAVHAAAVAVTANPQLGNPQ